jgi:hypothetical protein
LKCGCLAAWVKFSNVTIMYLHIVYFIYIIYI